MAGAAEALALWFSKRRALDLYIITQCHDDLTERSARTLLQQENIRGLNLDVRAREEAWEMDPTTPTLN